MPEAINTLDITADEQERKDEGQVGLDVDLDISLSDSELAAFLKYKMDESEKYWNEKPRSLDEARKRAESFWLGKYQDNIDYYTWEYPYSDPRLFMSVETIIPIAISKPPEPLIAPAKDTDASRQLAEDLGNVLLAKSAELKLRGKFRMSLRHLILYRLGCLKYRWDKDIGENGDIVVEWVRPQKLLIDKYAVAGKNPGFVAEYMEGTVGELSHKFPKKKQELWSKYQVVRGTEKQLSRRVGYYECWFTYRDKKTGQQQEGVAWKLDKIILDKQKNPNWDYTGSEGELLEDGSVGPQVYHNHLNSPVKPYVFLNFLNLGRGFVDDVALIETAIPLQKTLDKRGQQIVENADAANSGWVFDKNFIAKKEASKLTGAFDEKVVGEGDVRAGAARLPPPALPQYVMDDKYDARAEIDNILGTHSTTRGERGKSETLGGRMLLKQADIGRIGDLVESAIEPAAQDLYNGMVQMMKVYYTEEHFIKHVGEDGSTTFLTFKNDKIEDGVEVVVKSGGTLPTDKDSQRVEALELAKAQLSDPLTLFEKLDHTNPKDEARRLILYQADPKLYMTEILDEKEGMDFNQEATRNIQLINEGEYVDPPEDVSEEYLMAYTNYVQSEDFKNLEPEVQALHTQHLEKAMMMAKTAMKES
tara:strand:- start:45 stop:1982 length:1938 start_codon:yes stop_codon:yes gene_type:complete